MFFFRSRQVSRITRCIDLCIRHFLPFLKDYMYDKCYYRLKAVSHYHFFYQYWGFEQCFYVSVNIFRSIQSGGHEIFFTGKFPPIFYSNQKTLILAPYYLHDVFNCFLRHSCIGISSQWRWDDRRDRYKWVWVNISEPSVAWEAEAVSGKSVSKTALSVFVRGRHDIWFIFR